jgi:hypothetical protein
MKPSHTGPERKHGLARLLALALTCCCVLTSFASGPRAPEYAVKAAFLINIAKYADWPEHALPPDAPIVIAIVGDDPFGPVLETLARDRRVNERRIVIERFSRPQELRPAHVVFVSRSLGESVAQIRSSPGAEYALLVGDSEYTAGFAAINFSVADNRIVFEVNLSISERTGVKISSKLLHLAQRVTHSSSKTVLRK